MNNEFFTKEYIAGLMGMGGGPGGSSFHSGAGEGKFTINDGTEYTLTEGYSSPVHGTLVGGSNFTMEVTSGPFTATVKLWGGGGAVGDNGGTAGCGGYLTGEVEFEAGKTYHMTAGGGGYVYNDPTAPSPTYSKQPIGGGGGTSSQTGGGAGFSGVFRAPPTNYPTARTQPYAVMIAGGGGGSGRTATYMSYYEPAMGGGGGYGTPSPQRGRRGDHPSPTLSGAGGGSSGGEEGNPGNPTEGGKPGIALFGGTTLNRGGGGGGGYWGGGSGGRSGWTNYGSGGGGGGFVCDPTNHPDSVQVSNTSGSYPRGHNSGPPFTAIANGPDPDRGGAAVGKRWNGNSPNQYQNGGRGKCGRVVIKAPE